MKKYITLICALVIVLSFQCKAQDPIFSDALKKNIELRVKNEIITGIVIGVITEEGTKFYSHGVKSLQTKEPVDKYSVFEIGSNTKTFTGLLLANEVINGELNLDTPLQKLLPEGITAPTRNGQTIKLVNLANHSSSLPRLPSNFTPSNPANPFGDYTEKQLYDFLESYELPRDIGSKFEYSNYGMGLLGTLLATKNNTTYEELMLKNIANPLGMKNTRLTLNPDMKKELAKGHSNGVEVESWEWDISALAGAGAIQSTAVDMLKYLEANMGLKETDLYPAMELAHKLSGSGDGGTIEVGLGWITSDIEGEEVIWHDGGTSGYMSFMGFTKDGKKGVVVLTNSTGFPDDIGFHIFNPDYALANPKPSIALKINKLLKEKGLESTIQIFADLLKNHADDYNFSENEFVNTGYSFIGKGKTEEAVAIFKMYIAAHPEAWNAYDCYGDALKANSETAKAIESYRKSLELNPENTNGINMLKELGVDIKSSKK